jgi:hypothetical protein
LLTGIEASGHASAAVIPPATAGIVSRTGILRANSNRVIRHGGVVPVEMALPGFMIDSTEWF